MRHCHFLKTTCDIGGPHQGPMSAGGARRVLRVGLHPPPGGVTTGGGGLQGACAEIDVNGVRAGRRGTRLVIDNSI